MSRLVPLMAQLMQLDASELTAPSPHSKARVCTEAGDRCLAIAQPRQIAAARSPSHGFCVLATLQTLLASWIDGSTADGAPPVAVRATAAMQPHCRRMQALLLLCTLLSAAIISADAQSCGFGGMDFSSLSHSDITAQVSSTELDGSCLLRICGVLDSTVCRDPLQGGVADAAACLVYTEPTGTVTPGGEWNSQVVWKYVNDDPTQGVQYSMDCDNCEMFSASTTVTFTCATSFGPVVATGSQYVQFYSVPTRKFA